MSKNDPVKEVQKARADYTKDALAEMGFGGVSDKKVAKANTKESADKLDAVEDQYGIGKAAKGPSAASRIGKAFRNFGSKIAALVKPAPAPQTAAPTAPAVEAPKMRNGRIIAKATMPGAYVPDATTRAETLASAKAKTVDKGKSQDRGIGR